MPESIGQRLKKEREARYLTLEKVSQATRIRTIFLQALEADDYSALPSAVQGRGFLRNYAEYLDLHIDEMIVDIQKNVPAVDVSGPLPQVNLVETEIPPLVNERDENLALPFWVLRLRSVQTRWLDSRPKAESAPEAESTELALKESPAPVVVEVEVEQSKPRGRKKKKIEEPVVVESASQKEEVTEIKVEEQSPLIEAEQPEDKEEAKPSLILKFEALFRSRISKIDPKQIEETAPVMEAVAARSIPTQPADVIFAEIGTQLRARREMISLTMDEVERHTKLRVVFVKALEEGAFDKLPSSVQTRGMLANYATFLDLDTEAILLRFADGLQARRHEKYSETPREKIQTEVITSMPFLRSFIAGDLVFGVVMIATLVALAIWGVGRLVGSQNVQPTVSVPLNVIGGTSTPAALLDSTVVPVDENPLVAGTETLTALETPSAPGSNANVAVSVFAVERVFVRISVDGKVVFEGRLAPRESKLFEAEDQVVILIGNAAALRITYNGRDLGFMGSTGEVLTRVYLITGIATPTATLPPTPTATSRTPPVTSTSTPTRTPAVTPTSGG